MWHAVYNIATGALLSVGTVLGELPAGAASMELGETKPTGQWDTTTKTFVAVSALPERWTRYEFLMRLTAAERIAIRNKASTDPIVFDFMDMLNISGDVVRSNPVVMQGLGYCVSVGCLAAGRPQEIMNG